MATTAYPNTKPAQRGRWIAAGIAVIVLAIIAALVVTRPAGQPAGAATATASVVRGGITATVAGTSTIAAEQSLDLSFPINGTVTEVLVSEGETVRVGQLLARLDTRDLQLQVDSATASLVAPAADSSATVTGVAPAYQEVNNLTLSAGRFFGDEQVSGASPVIVLGATLATDLFGSGQAVGQNLRVDSQALRVIGVLNAEGGGGFGSVDDQAFVPITVAQQRLFGARTPDGNDYLVSSIGISVIDSADINSVQARVETLLRERHELLADGSEDDFSVLNQASFLTTLTTITSLFTLFLGAVAAISLLVGGIGIMNIMLVSVTERTREIGLRKAVGARGQDILLQFVVEALALSLAGGVVGLALGAVIPVVVTLLGVLEAPVTLSSALIAVGFSLAVGLFFGIYPARRAARLDPIEALRHE